MTKIGLCMIVKDEGDIIRRCLDSVRPLIDYAVIHDTGSTDDTIEKIKTWLAENKIEGKVISSAWVDFAFNRTKALESIRENKLVDYVLMIDADEIIQYDKNFDSNRFKELLTKDLYEIRCKLGNTEYLRPTLTKNSVPFVYRGVVHEYLYCLDTIKTRDLAKGILNIPIQDSSRNKNYISKFLNDAEKLIQALKSETDFMLRTRYTFYIGQCYSDAKEYAKALPYFLERAKMGGWNEEAAVAYYRAANLMSDLNYPEEQVIQTYLSGFELCNVKLECLHGAAKYCRLKKKFQQAFMIASLGLKVKKPDSGLFIQSWIWDYGIEDEYTVAAYWAGFYQEGLDVAKKLIHKAPDSYKERVSKNINHLLNKLKNAS